MVDLRPETWDAADPMRELRVFASWHVLRAVSDGWYPEFADWLLNNGVYCDAIREIWEQTYPYEAGVYRLFDRALVELGVARPSRHAAVRVVMRRSFELLTSTDARPREVLRALDHIVSDAWNELAEGEQLKGLDAYWRDEFDAYRLFYIAWSYSEAWPYYDSQQRVITDPVEREALLDSLARREAAAWLEWHPEDEA